MADTETLVERCERNARAARNESRIDRLEERVAHLEHLLDPGPNAAGPDINLVAVHELLRRKGMHLTDKTILDIVTAALTSGDGT